jgi:hypothetical protein
MLGSPKKKVNKKKTAKKPGSILAWWWQDLIFSWIHADLMPIKTLTPSLFQQDMHDYRPQ